MSVPAKGAQLEKLKKLLLRKRCWKAKRFTYTPHLSPSIVVDICVIIILGVN
jgi:hypothetical protein